MHYASGKIFRSDAYWVFCQSLYSERSITRQATYVLKIVVKDFNHIVS